jgi:ribonuclease Y
MNVLWTIIATIFAFLAGGLLTWITTQFLLKSRRDKMLVEAEKEIEVMKKNKMLEVKEKFIQLKS